MKTIQTQVYEYDELDDAGKEGARQWFAQVVFDFEWWDSTYEDAKTIGLEITSFDLDRNRHATGKLIYDAVTVAEKIMQEHGKDSETYKTAAAYLAARKKAKGNDDAIEEAGEEFKDSLLEDYSIMLQKESEYMLSDECLEEGIRANEYTFTKDGKRFG